MRAWTEQVLYVRTHSCSKWLVGRASERESERGAAARAVSVGVRVGVRVMGALNSSAGFGGWDISSSTHTRYGGHSMYLYPAVTRLHRR
jgi:hypothetical protein